MALFTGYRGANTCTDGPQPGARALMAWYLAAYGSKGADNDGIYNCRSQRGAKALSLHGEGRAADLGCPAGADWAQKLANRLVASSKELGVQCVIFNRRIWSGAYPSAGWRPYHGVDPHTEHLHVELSWDAARNLTADRVKAVMTPRVAITHNLRRPDGLHEAPDAQVRAVQKRLEAHRKAGHFKFDKPITADGRFGADTEDAVEAFQRARGLAADGDVGKLTVAALGGPLYWKG